MTTYEITQQAVKLYVEEKEEWLLKTEIERIEIHLWSFLRWFKIKMEGEK
jgi:hypothetical protein